MERLIKRCKTKSTEYLEKRRDELIADIEDSNRIIDSGEGHVSRRGHAADKRLLKIIERELRSRKIANYFIPPQ